MQDTTMPGDFSPGSPPATRTIEVDPASALAYILIGRAKHRREGLEEMYASMKTITISSIPLPSLRHLKIDLNPLDIHSGNTSPYVGPYFMPQANTPMVTQLISDASWDCFLSQKGNFGNGAPLASHLLRQAFMNYQDWGSPDVWHRKLEGVETEDDENDLNCFFQESGFLDDEEGNLGEESESYETSEGNDKEDLAEESESYEMSEGNDEEAENDQEPTSILGLDQDSRIYRTDEEDICSYRTEEWLVYHSQKLFDLEIPDKLHGIDLARSMELNLRERRHAWALMNVNLCGDDYPSTAELLALVRWTLRGMYSQDESIRSGIGRQDVTDIFPTMLIVFDHRCCARVLYGYFDGRFKVQFTPILDFKEFTEVVSEDLDEYLARIDSNKYCDMMRALLCWAWPCCYCSASDPFLENFLRSEIGIEVAA